MSLGSREKQLYVKLLLLLQWCNAVHQRISTTPCSSPYRPSWWKTLKLPSSSSDFLELSISFSGSDWQVGQMLLYKQVTWSVEPIWSQLRSIHTSHTRPRARTHTNTRTLIYKKKEKHTQPLEWLTHPRTHMLGDIKIHTRLHTDKYGAASNKYGEDTHCDTCTRKTHATGSVWRTCVSAYRESWYEVAV